MANVARFTAPLFDLDTYHVFNDFDEDQSDIVAVDTITDTGSVAIGDAVGGQVVLTPSDGTVADNDEAYLATPNEVFKLASGKPLYARARLQFAETTSDRVNIAFGFQNAVGANSIVDNGGLKVSGDTIALYKHDAQGMYWHVAAYCNGSGQALKTSRVLAAATWYVVEIFVVDRGDGNATATFKVDGEYLRDFTTNEIIRITVTISSSTEMQLFAGVKLGAGTNNDTLTLDYWYAHQQR